MKQQQKGSDDLSSLCLLIAIYSFGACGETADFRAVKTYLRAAEEMCVRLGVTDVWIEQWKKYFGVRYDVIFECTGFPPEVVDVVSGYELHLCLV